MYLWCFYTFRVLWNVSWKTLEGSRRSFTSRTNGWTRQSGLIWWQPGVLPALELECWRLFEAGECRLMKPSSSQGHPRVQSWQKSDLTFSSTIRCFTLKEHSNWALLLHMYRMALDRSTTNPNWKRTQPKISSIYLAHRFAVKFNISTCGFLSRLCWWGWGAHFNIQILAQIIKHFKCCKEHFVFRQHF